MELTLFIVKNNMFFLEKFCFRYCTVYLKMMFGKIMATISCV